MELSSIINENIFESLNNSCNAPSESAPDDVAFAHREMMALPEKLKLMPNNEMDLFGESLYDVLRGAAGDVSVRIERDSYPHIYSRYARGFFVPSKGTLLSPLTNISNSLRRKIKKSPMSVQQRSHIQKEILSVVIGQFQAACETSYTQSIKTILNREVSYKTSVHAALVASVMINILKEKPNIKVPHQGKEINPSDELLQKELSLKLATDAANELREKKFSLTNSQITTAQRQESLRTAIVERGMSIYRREAERYVVTRGNKFAWAAELLKQGPDVGVRLEIAARAVATHIKFKLAA
jgi:hypothetical protein